MALRPGPDRKKEKGWRDDDVVKIHGWRTAQAVLDRRLEAVVRGYFDERRTGDFASMMHALAERRVAYRLVPEGEIERVSGSRHHEGVCLLVKPRPLPSLDDFVHGCPAAAVAVLLDGAENPHNLGAVVRTAAHFGAAGVWVVGQAPLHGAMARVAEGGTESVHVFSTLNPVEVIEGLRRAGFQVVGASQRGSSSLFEHRFSRRSLIVLGSERRGLSSIVEARLEAVVRIPGTDAVESLNVASAAAVCLAEYARQRAGRATGSAEGAADPVRREGA